MDESLSEIKENAADIDSEAVFATLSEYIDSFKANTYIEALMLYITENDIDFSNVKKIICPSLYDILFSEAKNKNMLIYTKNHIDIADFL